MIAAGGLFGAITVRAVVLGAILTFANPAVATVPVAPVVADPGASAPLEKPAPEMPFVPQTDRLDTLPSSLADGVRALAQPAPAETWNAAWVRRGLSLRETLRAAVATPWLLPLTLAGVALIVIASYARRRQRRRVGWGMLPERTPRRVRAAPQD